MGACERLLLPPVIGRTRPLAAAHGFQLRDSYAAVGAGRGPRPYSRGLPPSSRRSGGDMRARTSALRGSAAVRPGREEPRRGGDRFTTPRTGGANPYPSVGFLQSCPRLRLSCFVVRIHEAAVRDLRAPATCSLRRPRFGCAGMLLPITLIPQRRNEPAPVHPGRARSRPHCLVESRHRPWLGRAGAAQRAFVELTCCGAQGLPAKHPSATSTSAFTPVFMYFSSIRNCGGALARGTGRRRRRPGCLGGTVPRCAWTRSTMALPSGVQGAVA